MTNSLHTHTFSYIQVYYKSQTFIFCCICDLSSLTTKSSRLNSYNENFGTSRRRLLNARKINDSSETNKKKLINLSMNETSF